MEFLIEFDLAVPEGALTSEVERRTVAEASAAGTLADEGHLLRVWRRPVAGSDGTILGLYRAESRVELDTLLAALPLYDWMRISVTPLEPHPNDPGVYA